MIIKKEASKVKALRSENGEKSDLENIEIERELKGAVGEFQLLLLKLRKLRERTKREREKRERRREENSAKMRKFDPWPVFFKREWNRNWPFLVGFAITGIIVTKFSLSLSEEDAKNSPFVQRHKKH